MLEINVSRLARSIYAGGVEPSRVSCSIVEAGPDAGPMSWRAALTAGRVPRPLIRRRQCQAVRDYFEGYGAWDAAELARWSWDDCCAIVLQFAAGDLREAQRCAPGNGIGEVDWAEYQVQAEAGRLSGNLFVAGRKLYVSFSN